MDLQLCGGLRDEWTQGLTCSDKGVSLCATRVISIEQEP